MDRVEPPAVRVEPLAVRAARPPWWQSLGHGLRDRLPLWIQLRCGLEPKSLAALVVVLVVAAVFAGTHFWSARPQAVRVPEPVVEAVTGPAGASAPVGLPAGPSPAAVPFAMASAPGAHIVVDVSGKVLRPGIQELPPGSRVADALRAAGGVREGADSTGLNRARVLTDGEQVVVGVPGAQPAQAGPAGGTGGSAGGGRAGPVAPISLNAATPEQLETLPGVGPVLAGHIIDYRTEHGGYRSVDQLREVSGIGDRRFAELRPLVRP
ncbi:helix-hairpin-helix domain-containing protein [Streptomyces nitrosporeus]